MSSRVHKGSTVFRPVTKARSRPPTANPPLALSDPIINPNAAAAASSVPTMLLPIPSTAVPGRDALKQVISQQPDPVPVVPQHPQHEPPTLPRGSSIPSIAPSSAITFQVSTSNSALLAVGRCFTANQTNAVDVPSHLESRTPVAIPHPLHLATPDIPIVAAGPSQQSTVFLTPSVPPRSDIALAASSDSHNFTSPSTSRRRKEDTTEPLRRKRKISKTISDGEVEGTSRKKPKSRSTTPRQRRSRGPSLPPYDPNANPGEDIDPTIVTMATLCSDTGYGRVSSKAAEILNNHAAWKVKNRERRARMKAIMEAKKYGRSADEDAERTRIQTNTLSEAQAADPNAASSSVGSGRVGGDDESGFDYSQHMETSRYNVQVRIGPNGETIIDEDSLVVDRTENEDTSTYTHVVESDHTKFVNSGTYGKRYRGSRWSAEETELFYHALSQYGENYELIAYVLPGRDRKSCKNKFKAEDKKNHARINYCLNNRIPVDMKMLERMTGKDFSGPTPEIRAPPPPPSVVVPLEPTEGTSGDTRSQTAASKQVKKRSRSRTAGLEDGVTIVGDVDSIQP